MNIHTSYGVVTEPGTVRIERLLPGPVERIWSYLTDSEKRSTWLAAGPMELKLGGRVENVFRNGELTENDDPPPAKYAVLADAHTVIGEITACEPCRLLTYSWGDQSEVSFELEPRGDKVLLVVTHRKLASYDGMLSVAAGWHTHLGILAARLEGREPEGFWRTHTALEAEYGQRIDSSQVAKNLSKSGQ